MKKKLLLSSFLMAGTVSAFAQSAYVKQYFFTSGGTFLRTGNQVKVGIVKDNKVQYIDSSAGDFSNVVDIYYNPQSKKYEGSAHIGRSGKRDLLVRYDLDTYERIDSVYTNGVEKLARNEDKLVLAKGYESEGGKIDILNARTLQLIQSIDGTGINATNTSDVKIVGDSAYVSRNISAQRNQCPGQGFCFDSLGFIAIINLTNNTLDHTIQLGESGAGISGLVVRREADNRIHIYATTRDTLEVTENNVVIHGFANAAITGVTSENRFAVNIEGAKVEAVRTDHETLGSERKTIYRNYTGSISARFDTINNFVLLLKVKYDEQGSLVRYNYSQSTLIDSVQVGISTTALAIDYRPTVTTRLHTNNDSEVKVILYPNPAKSFVKLKNIATYTQYEIKNLAGQIVTSALIQGVETSIDTESLTPGIYLVSMKGQHGEQTLKFIKE